MLEVTQEAKERLINGGFDDRTGARGIRRVLEENIEDPISEMIILGQIKAGETAELGIEDDKMSMKILKATGATGKCEA
jgi:ATP-dependent Clp protease ATP-binding subunit ClpC